LKARLRAAAIPEAAWKKANREGEERGRREKYRCAKKGVDKEL